MIKLNRKILGLAVILIAVAMLATPVLADSTKRVSVDIDLGSTPPTTATYWLKGDVQHGSVTIPYSGSSITGDGINLQDGTAIQIANYVVNVKGIPTGFREGKGVLHNKLEITFSGGKFIGNNNVQGIFKVAPNQKVGLYTGSAHAVLRGTGDYLGWTLVFSSEASMGSMVEYEAYMLIP